MVGRFGDPQSALQCGVFFARARLVGFKVPRRIVFGPVPRTATGKMQKYLLRERARALPTEG